MFVISKRAGERLDYAADFAEWLKDGDSISSFTLVAQESSLVAEDAELFGTAIRFWLFGGEPSMTYGLDLTITTAGGRTKAVCIRVRNLAQNDEFDPLVNRIVIASGRLWNYSNFTLPEHLG